MGSVVLSSMTVSSPTAAALFFSNCRKMCFFHKIWFQIFIFVNLVAIKKVASSNTELNLWKETKQELEKFRRIVNNLKINQEEVRQSANDHTIVHWLKNTVVELRHEMTQLELKISADTEDHCAMKNFVKKTELEFLQQRMNKEFQQMRQDFKDLEINLHKKQFKFSGPAIGPKMSTKNERNFSEEQIRRNRDAVIGLQAGTNVGATQSGMGGMGNTRHM